MFGVAWMKVGFSLDCLVTEEPHGGLEGLRVQDNMEWISLFPGNIQQLVWVLSFLANTSATIDHMSQVQTSFAALWPVNKPPRAMNTTRS